MISPLALLLLACPLRDSPALRYELLVDDPGEAQVDVSVTLSGLDPAQPTLDWRMTERYAFVVLEEPRLAGSPRVRDGAGRELKLERLGPRRWTLHKGEAREVHLEWSVELDHRLQEGVVDRDEYEFPYLEEDHGLLQTAALLLVPELESLRCSIALDLPVDWESNGPWPRDAEGVYHPRSRRSLASNFIAVGDWSRHRVEVSGASVGLLFSPGQEALEELAVPVIEPLIEAELALFEHQAFESYLILFGRPDGSGMGGSPKHSSMTLFVQPELVGKGYVREVAHLAAHELFHTWAASRFDAPDELRFWNEGFTDYYAHLLPARLGQTGWHDFAQTLGSSMTAWERNERSAALSPVEAGGPEFFEGGPAYWLVYRSGLVMAALWDLEIRRATGGERSLDDLMRRFTNDPRWSRERAPSLAQLEEVLAKDVGEERAAELMGLARRRGVPDFVAEFAKQGVEVRRLEEPSRGDGELELRRYAVPATPWQRHQSESE